MPSTSAPSSRSKACRNPSSAPSHASFRRVAYAASKGLCDWTFPVWKYCCAGPTIEGVTLMDGPSSQPRFVPVPSFPRMKSTTAGVIPQVPQRASISPALPAVISMSAPVAGSHV